MGCLELCREQWTLTSPSSLSLQFNYYVLNIRKICYLLSCQSSLLSTCLMTLFSMFLPTLFLCFFLLNKLLNNSLLHSLLTLKSVVIPTLLWILPEQCNQMGGQHLCDHKEAIAIYSFLRSGLVEIFYVSATFYMLICFLFVKNVTDHVSVLGIPINTQISNLLWCTKLFNLH